MRINKEKAGLTVKFSVRLPRYQHNWLKDKSGNTRGTNSFESMNTMIKDAIDIYMRNVGE